MRKLFTVEKHLDLKKWNQYVYLTPDMFFLGEKAIDYDDYDRFCVIERTKIMGFFLGHFLARYSEISHDIATIKQLIFDSAQRTIDYYELKDNEGLIFVLLIYVDDAWLVFSVSNYCILRISDLGMQSLITPYSVKEQLLATNKITPEQYEHRSLFDKATLNSYLTTVASLNALF